MLVEPMGKNLNEPRTSFTNKWGVSWVRNVRITSKLKIGIEWKINSRTHKDCPYKCKHPGWEGKMEGEEERSRMAEREREKLPGTLQMNQGEVWLVSPPGQHCCFGQILPWTEATPTVSFSNLLPWQYS